MLGKPPFKLQNNSEKLKFKYRIFCYSIFRDFYMSEDRLPQWLR